MPPEPGEIRVEVVGGDAGRQQLVEIVLPAASTVADAIARSRIEDALPELELGDMQAGVWGRIVERTQVLRDGDRVELYRPLELDPREARRLRAEADR